MNENRPRRRAAAAQAAQATRKTSKKARVRRAKINRLLSTIALMMLVAVVSIGGTMAWLQVKTDAVVNTFTSSDINITLTETGATENEQSFKMVPGCEIAKDPKVTVTAGSEPCWLFVKIDKSENYDTYMNAYAVHAGQDYTWTALTQDKEGNAVSGVYYIEGVDASSSAQEYYVLAASATNANGHVTVSGNVTKEQMNALTEETYPKLSFTAYAVQSAGFTTAAEAWAQALTQTVTNNGTGN